MKIKNDDEILQESVRKKIIEEITGEENIRIKARQLRKHEVYRDRTSKWVIADIEREGFEELTKVQMCNRVSNISICRKIVNKLAQAYVGGVQRNVEDEVSQESIERFERELDVNTKMKEADQYRQLFKTTMLGVIPKKNNRESTDTDVKWEIMLQVFAPWQYDAVEDNYIPTRPRVVIFSEFKEQERINSLFTDDQIRGAAGIRPFSTNNQQNRGDNREQVIADSPEDEGQQKRQFIWWTDKYHFTTDEAGVIIPEESPENLLNPIGILPLVNISQEQDGSFWPKSGEDVVDASVLINKIMTDINFITFHQGWGRLVVSGKNVPKTLVSGPDKALTFSVDGDDPAPQVFYATSNPPIDSWLETVKTILAMVLSTNDLSPRNISARLEANNAASGIALLIEQSESTSDIQDTQQLFRDKEPLMWHIIKKWREVYDDNLVKDQQDIPAFSDDNVRLVFNQIRPVVSESERLANLKTRKDLGLSTMKELLMLDNPDLSEEEAKQRIEEIANEKQERKDRFTSGLIQSVSEKVGLQPNQEDENAVPEAEETEET